MNWKWGNFMQLWQKEFSSFFELFFSTSIIKSMCRNSSTAKELFISLWSIFEFNQCGKSFIVCGSSEKSAELNTLPSLIILSVLFLVVYLIPWNYAICGFQKIIQKSQIFCKIDIFFDYSMYFDFLDIF